MSDTPARLQCNICHKQPPAPDRKSCPACLERACQGGRIRRKARLAQGLCARCGTTPPRPGKTECTGCVEYQRRRYDSKTAAADVRNRYWARVNAGLCARCGKTAPVEERRFCVACTAQSRQHGSRKRAKRRAEGRCVNCGRPAVPGLRQCSACAEKGRHYQARWETLPVWSPTYTVYDCRTGDCLGTWESREDVALCLAFAKRGRDEVEIVTEAPLFAAYAGR